MERIDINNYRNRLIVLRVTLMRMHLKGLFKKEMKGNKES